MANREVTVRLRAEIGAYKSAMAAAEQATKSLAASGKTAFSDMQKAQAQHEQAWTTLSNTALVAGGSMVAAVGSVVAKYASFDKAMSAVQASTHASGEEMAKLRDLAMKAGADTAYSGEEAAAGINELAKAGVSTNDILRGGLTGALSLAAAGQIEVGEAAELASTAMTQFKLEGKDLGHVADLLAAGAGKAQGSVGDLGYALKQSGLVASQAGISIEETVGTLAAFASAGLVGSDAGTSFKTMLQKLQNPSKEAQRTLDELGVSMYDQQGNFVGMVSLADQLKSSMESLTPAQRDAAMATIFGADAVRAANVLYAQGGEGIQDWINKVNDAGYAAETAAALQDNLAGDLEKLGGAFDTIALQSGGSLNDMFRGLVQGATGLLEMIGQIPGPVLTAGTIIAGLGGSTVLAAGMVMKGVSAVAEFSDAAGQLGLTLRDADGQATKLGKSMGVLSKGLGMAALVFGMVEGFAALSRSMEEANISSSELSNAFADTEKGVANVDAAFASAAWANGHGSTYWDGTVEGINGVADAIMHLQTRSGFEGFIDWANDVSNFSSATLQSRDAIAELDAQLAGMASGGNISGATSAFKEWAEQVEASGGSVEQMANESFPELKKAVLDYATSLGVTLTEQETLQAMMGEMPPKLQEAASAAEGAGTGIEGMGGALEGMGAAAEEAKMPLDELVDALKLLGDIHISETQAMQDYSNSLVELQSGLAATGALLDETGTRFDTHTEAGQKANGMIISLREDMWSLVEAQAANGASQETLQATMAGTYQAMLDSMTAMGLTTEQAETLTRAVLGVPEGVSIDSWMSDSAKKMAQDTTGAVNRVPNSISIGAFMGSHARDMARDTKAAVDSIPAWKQVTIQGSLVGAAWGMMRSLTAAGSAGRYTGGFASPARGFALGGQLTPLQGFARGGLLPGVPPANPYQDNLPGLVVDTREPIMLRSREYIVNEPGTHRGENLSWLRWINAGGTMRAPAPRGFAAGGSPGNIPRNNTSMGTGEIELAIERGTEKALSGWKIEVNESIRGFAARMRLAQKAG